MMTGTIREIIDCSDGTFKPTIFFQKNRHWKQCVIGTEKNKFTNTTALVFDLSALIDVIEAQNETLLVRKIFLEKNVSVLNAIRALIEKKEESLC